MAISVSRVAYLRDMPFLKREMKVRLLHDGRFGKITSGCDGANLNIRFDGEKRSFNCHPKWKMQYFDKEGNLIKEYK